MKNGNKGIRKNTIIKSAVCFFIFYVIIMSALTILTTENVRANLQSASDNSFYWMQSELHKDITYNGPSHYTEANRMIDLNNNMIERQQLLSGTNIYCSAKLVDVNGNTICQTRNALYVDIEHVKIEEERKLIFLDEIMSQEQINELKSFTYGLLKSTITGNIKGCEIIPQKIICIRNDNKKIEFNFNNSKINNAKLKTYTSNDTYGVFEFKFNKTNEEVKAHVDNEIKKNLKPVIEGIKNGSSHSTYSEMHSSLFKFSYTSHHIVGNDETGFYFLAYSYAFFPLGLAMEQLIPLYIFCFIVTMLLIWILSSKLSNWIVKPILLLNKSAISMTNGERNVSYALETHKEDEIGQLADSLDFMSKQLNESMNRLEEDIVYRKKQEQSRRDLTNAIAHELKTPLGIIRNYSEGLKENIDENKKSHYLDVIIDETEQMDNMVIEMLNLSKLEANAYTLNPESFSLKAVTEEEIERYKKGYEEKQINFELMCMSEFVILADKTGIEYVISNFISNAIKHTPSGMKIMIKIESKDEKTSFSIENQGDNIPQDKLPKIWESFYKVDDSRERKYGGTGLGLAIAKNYLELHGAEYGCENTETGVKFWFVISNSIS